MLYEEVQKRQQQLTNLLFDMAESMKSEDEITIICANLCEIYNDGFRHVYSEFFSLIITIADKDEYNLEYLSNNLNSIRVFVEKNYTNGNNKFRILYRPIMKLCDHINLEIGRYMHYVIAFEQVGDLNRRTSDIRDEVIRSTQELERAKKSLSAATDEIERVRSKLDESSKKSDEMDQKLQDSNKRIENVQSELIAVLSIFAAIVFAFSGSLNLLSGAFENIANPQPGLKATFFVLLCGFVVSNTIFTMIYMVGKITGKSIYAKCKTLDCSCSPKCNNLKRIRQRLPYVFWLNVSLVILMFAVVLIWYLDRVWNIIP